MSLSELKILKQVLCPKDEDYEKPCISPQFLEQELDMLFEDLQYAEQADERKNDIRK